MTSVLAKHQAVVIVQPRAPLEMLEVDTIPPSTGEIVVRIRWFASTPLNLHNADGGLFVNPPHIMSGCFAGEVAQLGDLSSPQELKEYLTIPAYLCGKVPEGITLQAAATVPSNFVTAVHTATKDLGLELPWPVPEGWAPRERMRHAPILVWGSASSAGQYVLQVFKFWWYRNVLAVARKRHNDTLRKFGAAVCFDYTQQDVVQQILRKEADIPYIVDCIGSLGGTLTPLTKIAGKSSKVAVMLPVITRHASNTHVPEYETDVGKVLEGQWREGVEVRGVRTHFYTENEFLKNHLQPEIMPELLARGVIQPNKQRIVEGHTLLERAEKGAGIVEGARGQWREAGMEGC